MNGFFVIDKPAGISSHDVVSKVRRILGTRKVGHTGTLDPFATGVLPVAVNKGTKSIPFLDESSKIYEAVIRFGVTTDTLDRTGTTLNVTDPSNISRKALLSSLAEFTGSIIQIPPMFSAIKQSGQPLYKLARQGLEVDRKARNVQIYSIELLSFDTPYATIRVHCSRGTYIRTLADDIGSNLGYGGMLQELRRTASGPFFIEKSVTLPELEKSAFEGKAEELCISEMAALAHLTDIGLTAEGVNGLRFGRVPLWGSGTTSPSPPCSSEMTVRLTFQGNLVAIATIIPNCSSDAIFSLKRVLI